MTFASFAAAHGLRLDHPIADGRWHRVPTEDKPRRRNGAYVYDGRGGAVKNWATMTNFATYREDGDVARIDRGELRRAAAKAHLERKRAQAVAAAEATMIVKAAVVTTPRPAPKWGRGEAVAGHPYLTRKGFPTQIYLARGDELIVPMWANSKLVNVQRILPDGTKRFLAGGRAKGAVLSLGNERARQAWLVEGYATGLTVRAALLGMRLDARVVVCFSAGNLQHVAALGIGTHVCADHDASLAGQVAAETTQLPWVMPDAVGQDANDLMLACGLGAVAKMLRGCIAQSD